MINKLIQLPCRVRPLKVIIFVMFAIGFLLFASSASAANFYVSTTGSSSGDGSIENPWDLTTAFDHPSVVQPGDTIYLRGGTYNGIFQSRLTGTAESPITVRSYPGEWVTIDTQARLSVSSEELAFRTSGRYTHYRDFEITNLRTDDRGGSAHFANTFGNKYINLVIHDMPGSTFLRDENELYGSILYNIGREVPTLAHHQLYTSNDKSRNGSPTRFTENILVNSYRWHVHAYSEGVGLIEGHHFVGNVILNSGVSRTNTGRSGDNLLIGATNNVEDILLKENMTWAKTPTERNVRLGWSNWNVNQDITLLDNYFYGTTIFQQPWASITSSGNTFYSLASGNHYNPADFPDNTYRAASDPPPNQNKIFIRPNAYDDDRAHLIIYNWENLDTVSVDVSHILETGDPYEVRNGQNFFADPIISGTYNGEELILPMNAGFNPAQPTGSGLIEESEMTGRQFNVFVVMPPLEGGGQTLPPTSTPVPTATPTPTPVPGDANDDGTVDGLDYVIWLNNYNNSTDNGASDGDFNADGIADGVDYVVWLNNYNL